ncbi:hypothetical protein SAMN05216276_101774 [Streptosporangium subroseum]|uniref:Uncharacterized protein n=1 Tax=Streptosporangium subroseum TaxID=106412 RepID=A0A239HQA7_9ACTN|nr:hypothetical protein SAMN05216276_101774 [Streptosporangium subroseum]
MVVHPQRDCADQRCDSPDVVVGGERGAEILSHGKIQYHALRSLKKAKLIIAHQDPAVIA